MVTSFTRYNRVGREAQNLFERAMKKDGFHHLHKNLYLRYCSTSSNAIMHKERVKSMISHGCCDISIILSSDGQEQNTFHSLKRKHKKNLLYKKPLDVEFF